MFKKFLALPFLMLVATLGLAACNSDEPTEQEEPEEEKTVVALVNEEELYEKDWKMLADSMASQQLMQLRQMGIDPDSEEAAQYVEQIESSAEESALEQLIQQEAILQEAKANDFEAEKDTIDTQFENTKSQFETEEAFNTALEDNNLTVESYRESIEEQLVTQAYLEDNMDPVELSDEEIETAYDEYVASNEEQEQEPESFEDVESQLTEQLKQEKENAQIQEIVEGVMDEADIERMV